ncbi:unnamed protein product [Litomosoides sigmodontis]|uniref:Uncharacterized protein n=1 Tax=Litomosoides sigmodontis TaxID=42156 RepID=A0A3P6SW58_LITSI|nr:unnamed protein product [Litomosoides sigmodontis]
MSVSRYTSTSKKGHSTAKAWASSTESILTLLQRENDLDPSTLKTPQLPRCPYESGKGSTARRSCLSYDAVMPQVSTPGNS